MRWSQLFEMGSEPKKCFRLFDCETYGATCGIDPQAALRVFRLHVSIRCGARVPYCTPEVAWYRYVPACADTDYDASRGALRIRRNRDRSAVAFANSVRLAVQLCDFANSTEWRHFSWGICANCNVGTCRKSAKLPGFWTESFAYIAECVYPTCWLEAVVARYASACAGTGYGTSRGTL